MSLTVGSLFSGIGGLDLGLERAGMTVRWQVENDPYCNRVLAKHWPDVARYGDIKELDPHDLEPVDLICGGFPCQPVSLAGRGRAQEDERWLWPEYARIVRGVRPRFVLVENVPGLLVRGMGDVLGDLAELGYDTEWQSIPAAAVGAPHLRWRVFLVAYASGARRREDARGTHGNESQDVGRAASHNHQPDGHGQGGHAWSVADADSERWDGRPRVFGSRWRAEPAYSGSPLADSYGQRQQEQRGAEPTQAEQPAIERSSVAYAVSDGDRPQVFGREAGRAIAERSASGPSRSGWWATEPDVGRVAHGVPSRVDRLRGLGNAVVPQVAEYVGRRILEVAA